MLFCTTTRHNLHAVGTHSDIHSCMCCTAVSCTRLILLLAAPSRMSMSEQWKPSASRCGCVSEPVFGEPSAATVASRHGSSVSREAVVSHGVQGSR